MNYKKKFILGALVKGQRTCNNEVVEGKFNGFYLRDKSDSTSVFGVICVEDDRCYDVFAGSIELLESEDEVIRRKFIEALKECGFTHFDNEFTVQEALDWLEKQREQNPKHFELKAGHWYICHRAYCCRADHLTVKEGERFMCEEDGVVKGFVIKYPEKYFKEVCASIEDKQRSADIVEPKFKVGDWITNNYAVWYIESIHNGLYSLKDPNGGVIKNSNPETVDNKFHLWTIQDAKDGDVLALEWKDECQWQKIVIFKSLNEFGVEGYGNTFKNNKLAFKEDIPFYSKTWTKYLHPATKEQRDLLFQKPADKVEPKYKAGDWIQIEHGNVMQILDVSEFMYTVLSCYGDMDTRLISDIDSVSHLWTIQDAKDGDVLYSPEFNLCGYKNKEEYYAAVNLNYANTIHYGSNITIPSDVCPATKKQRDKLEKAITEAGYKWNAEKKELEKIDKNK